MSTFSSNSILPPQKGDQVPSPRPWPWPSYALSNWLSRPTNLPYNDTSSTGKKAGNDAQERIDKEVNNCSSVTRVSKLEQSGKSHSSDCENTTEVPIPFWRPFQSYQNISTTSTSTSGSTSTHSRNNFNYHQGETDPRTFKADGDEYNKNISTNNGTGACGGAGAGSFKYSNSAPQQNVEPAASQCPSSADAEKDDMRTNHRPTLKIKLFKCKLCPDVFMHLYSLRKHWRTHIIEEEATFKCPLCDKRLNSKNNAVYHLRIHMRDSPYKCDKCGMQFMSPYNLASHMNIHIDGGFKFLCSTCGALYKRDDHYTRHVNSCRGY